MGKHIKALLLCKECVYFEINACMGWGSGWCDPTSTNAPSNGSHWVGDQWSMMISHNGFQWWNLQRWDSRFGIHFTQNIQQILKWNLGTLIKIQQSLHSAHKNIFNKHSNGIWEHWLLKSFFFKNLAFQKRNKLSSMFKVIGQWAWFVVVEAWVGALPQHWFTLQVITFNVQWLIQACNDSTSIIDSQAPHWYSNFVDHELFDDTRGFARRRPYFKVGMFCCWWGQYLPRSHI